MAQSCPPQFKMVLIGSSSVGKTCLLHRFLDMDWSVGDVAANYGVDFRAQNMEVDGRKVKLCIWDTAGMEKFRAILPSFYRGAQGVILGTVDATCPQCYTLIIPVRNGLVYSISDRTSFDALPGWLADINHHAPSTTPKIIVGNKLDQVDRKVPTSDGESYAAQIGALFREASAKTSMNVTEVFEDLVKKMREADDLMKSMVIYRTWPQDEIIKLVATDQPKRNWWDKCKC
ncbi:P-loop containing nucleoside triphosphate hydrolase protein [Pisolithus orientalis]|uniref:P-loop containing nucleoside triphosphate hydrolase protein n=1 Tax=Pisolithus orientalis TaxID=936130 RepID=UPI002224EA5D|nr:P-loop containing nucleoside triphosphate hydrolase protein [Pisolithus orientalis]KAI5998508.1 P-loop containing nucleoside triphosphate hydrolase protein [Pisolithus orientalis]